MPERENRLLTGSAETDLIRIIKKLEQRIRVLEKAVLKNSNGTGG